MSTFWVFGTADTLGWGWKPDGVVTRLVAPVAGGFVTPGAGLLTPGAGGANPGNPETLVDLQVIPGRVEVVADPVLMRG